MSTYSPRISLPKQISSLVLLGMLLSIFMLVVHFMPVSSGISGMKCDSGIIGFNQTCPYSTSSGTLKPGTGPGNENCADGTADCVFTEGLISDYPGSTGHFWSMTGGVSLCTQSGCSDTTQYAYFFFYLYDAGTSNTIAWCGDNMFNWVNFAYVKCSMSGDTVGYSDLSVYLHNTDTQSQVYSVTYQGYYE